jgi:hypothetical protein
VSRMLGKFWFVGGSRGGRISGCFRIPDADIADIGNADDEGLSICSVAAGGVH